MDRRGCWRAVRIFRQRSRHLAGPVPSLYSSANNHLVAEAMGLVLAARMLPGHPDASAWLASGQMHLEDRALALFHEDGVGQEQSPAYSAFALEMLLIGFGALGHNAPGPKIRERMAEAASALNVFLDDAGHTPSIGDDDQSRVLLAFGSEEPRYTASIAAAIAGFLGQPELAPAVRDPHWRDIVFAAPGGALPTDGSVTLRHGGYTVRRGAIAGRRVHLVFDHGPLGFGALGRTRSRRCPRRLAFPRRVADARRRGHPSLPFRGGKSPALPRQRRPQHPYNRRRQPKRTVGRLQLDAAASSLDAGIRLECGATECVGLARWLRKAPRRRPPPRDSRNKRRLPHHRSADRRDASGRCRDCLPAGTGTRCIRRGPSRGLVPERPARIRARSAGRRRRSKSSGRTPRPDEASTRQGSAC